MNGEDTSNESNPSDKNVISAKLKDNDRTVTVSYEFGETLREAVQKFGEEVVFSRYLAAAVVDLQALLRRGIKVGKTDSEITSMVAAWRPGVKMVSRKSAGEKIKDAFAGMSDGDRKALLEELRRSLAA